MFGWHPRQAIDAFLGVTSDSPVNDHITYVSSLGKRLEFAYKTAAKVAEKASKRHKTRYDLRVRHSNLQKGDRILLKKVGFKGKHKLENKWERDPYIIESQPATDIPVYILTPEHRRSRKVKVHRNMLLPILSLPNKDIVREHTPPKPKRSKENDSSENSTQEMDEPNDVRISSDDDDDVYACSNKHGTHKPSRIDLNPRAAELWLSSPKSSSSGCVLRSRSEVLSSLSDTQQSFRSETDSNISVVTGNDPEEPPSFNSSHTRTSDIADAGDTVGQDFDRSDISIHEAQPALRRTARVSKVPQTFDYFILYR